MVPSAGLSKRAEELIARLAAEGELESSGSFTLDPEVALEKLRDFQLRDPTRFVLSWVRAGNLLGATRIDIEADADDVWVRFDGAALERRELESLWSAVVGLRGSPRVRACRELALGINGAFAWEAKHVAIRSGSTAVLVDRQFELELTQVEASEPTTVLHAKRPLGWELVRRRILDARGELPEELLLAQACRYARVPVYIDSPVRVPRSGGGSEMEGRRLEPPHEHTREWFRVEVDDDERHGFVRLRSGQESQLRVLVAGVEVLCMSLSFGAGQLDASIDDPRLPLDLAQERPIEAERWEALLELVARLRWQAWFGLARQRGWPHTALGDREGPQHRPLQALLADLHASCDRGWLAHPDAMAFADALPLSRAVTRPEGDVSALRSDDDASVELLWPWPVAEPEPLTLGDAVRSADARGELFVSPIEIDELAYAAELPVVLHAASPGLRALGAASLERTEIRARYRRALARVRTLAGDRPLPEAFLQLRHRVALPEGELHVRVAFERRASRRAGCLCLGRDGHLLARYRLPLAWGPLWAEIEGPLPEPDATEFPTMLATCVLALLERHHDLLGALATEPLLTHESALIREYLREAFGRWSAVRLRELDQLPAAAREQAIARWSGAWGVPSESLCAHPIGAIPWLEQLGRGWSLRELEHELARVHTLQWVPIFETRATPADIWRLDGDARAIIGRVFPDALRRFDHHAWARRVPGSQRVPKQLEQVRASTSLRGDAGELGVLGLSQAPAPARWAKPPRRGARLLLLARGHALGWMDVPLPTGSFVGVLEIPHARAVAHADIALRDQAWSAAAALVEAGARSLVHALLEQWAAGHIEPGDAAWVRDWMIDLECGRWPETARALARWQAGLAPGHPLAIPPPLRGTLTG